MRDLTEQHDEIPNELPTRPPPVPLSPRPASSPALDVPVKPTVAIGLGWDADEVLSWLSSIGMSSYGREYSSQRVLTVLVHQTALGWPCAYLPLLVYCVSKP